jgi:hypothetical protein
VPPKVVGSYDIVIVQSDPQDPRTITGWGRGPLYADGTIGGGGAYSYGNGENIGVIIGLQWQVLDATTVIMCFKSEPRRGEQNPRLPATGRCDPVPATGQPVVFNFIADNGLEVTFLLRVSLFHGELSLAGFPSKSPGVEPIRRPDAMSYRSSVNRVSVLLAA